MEMEMENLVFVLKIVSFSHCVRFVEFYVLVRPKIPCAVLHVD